MSRGKAPRICTRLPLYHLCCLCCAILAAKKIYNSRKSRGVPAQRHLLPAAQTFSIGEEAHRRPIAGHWSRQGGVQDLPMATVPPPKLLLRSEGFLPRTSMPKRRSCSHRQVGEALANGDVTLVPCALAFHLPRHFSAVSFTLVSPARLLISGPLQHPSAAHIQYAKHQQPLKSHDTQQQNQHPEPPARAANPHRGNNVVPGS